MSAFKGCFEGPLKAHLKQEVKKHIRNGQYVDIFSLIPLEHFNLDRARRDEKKEEDEKKWYRLIPRSFSNWLRAFAILQAPLEQRHQSIARPLSVIWIPSGKCIGYKGIRHSYTTMSSSNSVRQCGPVFAGTIKILVYNLQLPCVWGSPFSWGRRGEGWG